MAEINKIQPFGSSTQYDLRDTSKLSLSGGTMTGDINIGYNKQIVFYGKNNNTSPRALMGYLDTISGGKVHCYNDSNSYQTSGAFYITSNGCDAGNDNGGIAIDNEGVTVFGAGDAGTNFTGVFRVINEDSISTGPVFTVKKAGACYFGNGQGYYISNDGSQYTGKASNVYGTVAIGNGGTGATSAANARTNLDVPSRGGSGASGTWGISITGSAGSVAWGNVTGKPSTFAPSSHTHNYAGSPSAGGDANNARGVRTYGNDVQLGTANSSTNDSGDIVFLYGNGAEKSRIWTDNTYSSGIGPNYRVYNSSGTCLRSSRLWVMGEAITGAVWNDYAECRTATSTEPGYVWIEKGDDTLIKSSKRLQPFAGISSDTWGFSEGETETAKTHIAVAGRVLVYPYRDRNKYKPGQCVCAAPNGTVDIMHWWEIILFPDRIVGTVSCVPDYEVWGGGPDADRDPVKINGRIWIKVR